jgi:hypothetical protein
MAARLTALCLGLALAVAGAAAAGPFISPNPLTALIDWAVGTEVECTLNLRPGFEVHYVTPSPSPDDPNGSDSAGYRVPWFGGPTTGFSARGVTPLAEESLAWFEDSPESGKWYGNPTASLTFQYESAGRAVTVTYAPDADTSWEGQIHEWFERFPPTDPPQPPSGNYSWSVEYRDTGSICGCSNTAPGAVEAMKILPALPQAIHFSLDVDVRRAPRITDSYSEFTDRMDELDELPERLRVSRIERSQKGPSHRF